jgi:CMP/dCMP kinase
VPPPRVIAIDGPAASGKTTLAQRLADRLGYLFFDTGVMYRAATLAALQRNVAIDNQAQVEAIAEGLEIDVRPSSLTDGRLYDVIVDGSDVTWAIRSRAVDAQVSQVSAYAGVRRAMTKQQRQIGRRGRVVMAGRDIGTVVMPEADVKLYVIASRDERSRRRYRELIDRGESADLEAIDAAMQARDRFDASRELAPMRPAADAHVLDTTALTIDEAVERAMEWVGA